MTDPWAVALQRVLIGLLLRVHSEVSVKGWPDRSGYTVTWVGGPDENVIRDELAWVLTVAEDTEPLTGAVVEFVQQPLDIPGLAREILTWHTALDTPTPPTRPELEQRLRAAERGGGTGAVMALVRPVRRAAHAAGIPDVPVDGSYQFVLHGPYLMYRSLAGLSEQADVPLRCPTCAAETGLCFVADDDTAHVICPAGHRWRHRDITPRVVLQLLSGQGTITVTDPRLPTGQAQGPLVVPEDNTAPRMQIPADHSPLEQLPEQLLDTEWELLVQTHSAQFMTAWTQATAWAAALFEWTLTCDPPRGFPLDEDLPADERVEERMVVVVLALALFHTTRRLGLAGIDAVPLAAVEADLEEQSEVVFGTAPAQSSPRGRLRIGDRARLRAADEPLRRRWSQAARDVLHAHHRHQDALTAREPDFGHGEVLLADRGEHLIESGTSQYWYSDQR